MQFVIGIANFFQDQLERARLLDFVAALGLRLYLAPVFFVAGANKWNPFDAESSIAGIVSWFDKGLGLPFPTVMAYLAWSAEYLGALALLVGVAVRWVTIPLMVTMVVAVTTVHWDNGWQAVADGSSPYASSKLGPLKFEDASEAGKRLGRAKRILRQNGDYDWLTSEGSFVINNNGIEWATTYLVMLLALFFIGAGRWVSVDYWIARRFRVGRAAPPR